MENNLMIFNNEEFESLQIINLSGKEYFEATNVAKSLGYSNPYDAIKRHCKKDGIVKYEVIDSMGRKQDINLLSEGNLYRLITKSKLPSAERFEKWVFEEIIPTIRKTGGYVANDDLFINTYLPFADDPTKALFKSTLMVINNQNKVIQDQRKEIEDQKKDIGHKEGVIVGLVEDITIAEKRQILNRVIRRCSNYQDRWRELYRQYEMKFRLNLNTRFKTYNSEHKPKLRNRLDYIDKVLNQIPELYSIACKLYENDVNELIEEMYSLQENKSFA